MCLVIYKLVTCLLSTLCLLSSFFPFNSQVFNVSNYILLHNYMVFIKKIFNHLVLSMKTFNDVVMISMVIRILLGTKKKKYMIV